MYSIPRCYIDAICYRTSKAKAAVTSFAARPSSASSRALNITHHADLNFMRVCFLIPYTKSKC